MKRLLILPILALLVFSTGCRKDHDANPNNVTINESHPLKNGLQTIIDKYVQQGIPGIQTVIKDKNGWYATKGGYGNTDNHTPIYGDSTTWVFSITKTYTAALILKQKEKGSIELDAPINKYLPQAIKTKLKGSDKISVRMLLNHSSGLVNFIELDAYRARQFDDPLNQPSNNEILDMVYDEDLMFEPGTESYYSNTNYLLLGIILEQVTGKTYEQLLNEQIIKPLGLKHTFYNLSSSQISSLGFPSYYFDPAASGQLQDGTLWNHALGNASRSWGGIAARPSDVILFYEALVKGKVVNAASLQEMKNFKNDYGLGIESYQYKPGSTLQFGHEGDGVGNSTMILYIPDQNAFVFINCTVGRQLPGPFLDKIIQVKNELCSYVANH